MASLEVWRDGVLVHVSKSCAGVEAEISRVPELPGQPGQLNSEY